MEEVVISKNGARIRLNDERWAHIIEGHAELSRMRTEVVETVANLARIYAGGRGELLATREVEVGKWMVVVYREMRKEGFVITAFLTRRITALEGRKQLWP